VLARRVEERIAADIAGGRKLDKFQGARRAQVRGTGYLGPAFDSAVVKRSDGGGEKSEGTAREGEVSVIYPYSGNRQRH